MKKWSLCGSFLLIILSTMLAATGCGLAVTADESFITSEQSSRTMIFATVMLCVAIAIQPMGAWLIWRASPDKHFFAGSVLGWLAAFVGADVILFLTWLWFMDAPVQVLFRRLTRS